MIKTFIAVVTVLSLTTNNNLSATTIEYPGGCWATADAAEVHTCGSVGCDFYLWDAVYYACMEYEELN